MSTQNKLIAAAAAALVILIFLTLLVQSFFRKKEEETKKITTPTNTYETRRGSSTGIEQNQFEAGRKYATYKKIAKPLSSSENQKVEEAKKKLPFSSDNLNIEYSPFVGQFIVSKKTPDADQKFQEWLGQNGLEDIYKKNPGLFAETDLSLTEYKSLVDKGINNPQNLPQQSRFLVSKKTALTPTFTEEENPDLPTKSFKDLQKVVSTLFSFDLSGLNKAIDESNKEGGSTGGGTVNIQGRTVGKTTLPEGPNCVLTHVQIAAAAVIGRYGNSPSPASIDWNWVAEAVAIAIPENGGRCYGVADNYTSWGLWQDDFKPYIHYSEPNCKNGIPPTVNNNCAALFDPIINAKVMWLIYSYPPNQAYSQSKYGNNWGAYWNTAQSDSGYRYRDFLDEGQQAALQLKSQL